MWKKGINGILQLALDCQQPQWGPAINWGDTDFWIAEINTQISLSWRDCLVSQYSGQNLTDSSIFSLKFISWSSFYGKKSGGHGHNSDGISLLSNHLISLLSWLRHLVGSLKQSTGHQIGATARINCASSSILQRILDVWWPCTMGIVQASSVTLTAHSTYGRILIKKIIMAQKVSLMRCRVECRAVRETESGWVWLVLDCWP